MKHWFARRVADFIDLRLHWSVRFAAEYEGKAPCPCAACVRLRKLRLDSHGHDLLCDVHRHIWGFDMPHPCNCSARFKFERRWWKYCFASVRGSILGERNLASQRGYRIPWLAGTSIVLRALLGAHRRFDSRSPHRLRRAPRKGEARRGGYGRSDRETGAGADWQSHRR